MFTRCCFLSAAEEIKVKQNKGKQGKAGETGWERGRVREARRRETARDKDPAGYMWWGTRRVKDALFGWEKCVIKVTLMFCCMVLFHSEDVHAQVHFTQNVLQMLHSQRQPTYSEAGWATTSLLDSNMATPPVQNTSMVTNTRKLMNCLTWWSFLILPALHGSWPHFI